MYLHFIVGKLIHNNKCYRLMCTLYNVYSKTGVTKPVDTITIETVAKSVMMLFSERPLWNHIN